MELPYVIYLLNRAIGGQMLEDGMGCSEPILSLKDGRIIDNFMLYYSDFDNGMVSGPVAQVGLQAESGTVAYVLSGDDIRYSVPPRGVMKITEPAFSEEEYEAYCRFYAELRGIAYRHPCSDGEKRAVSGYLRAMKKIVAPEMMRLYEEMVPEFFAWVRTVIGNE